MIEIDKNIRKLVYLLRENGWNTIQSCGHEYKGLIVIACYDGQFDGLADKCGVVLYLRDFLNANGYEHFEIAHKVFQWHGKIVEDVIILKLLDAEWDARWK